MSLSSAASQTIREIDISVKADRQRFIEFPFILYRGVAEWTPPVWLEMEEYLSPKKNGFFDHSKAGFFLVERAGEVVGRVAALWQRYYNEQHHDDTAFFYWFESIDDQTVADLLFEGCYQWSRARGLRHMLGPVGFSQPDPPGILVKGFEYEGTMNVPWHFPYYERLVVTAGFVFRTDYLSGYFDRSSTLPAELIAQGDVVLKRGDYSVASVRKRGDLWPFVRPFYETYLKAFGDVSDFFSMSPREFELLAGKMILVSAPDATKLISKEGTLVGFVVGVCDITPGLRRSKGKMLPFGWWHILSSRNRTKQCNIIALGVLPESQKGGANLLLLSELFKALHTSKFEKAEIVQIVGGNLNTHGDMTHLGAKWDKVHRVYRREIPPAGSVSRVVNPLVACFSVDVEQDCPPYLQSRHGMQEGMPRLLDLLLELGIQGTFFTTGEMAREFPEIMLRLVGEGHELACHGDLHRDFTTLDRTEARLELTRSLASLRQFAPVASFRAPFLRFPADYLTLLVDAGITLDSSVAAYKWGANHRMGPSPKGLVRIPASATSSVLRLPGWIREPWLRSLATPLVLFVHPWEAYDWRSSRLRLDCRFGTGIAAIQSWRGALIAVQQRGLKFERLDRLTPH